MQGSHVESIRRGENLKRKFLPYSMHTDLDKEKVVKVVTQLVVLEGGSGTLSKKCLMDEVCLAVSHSILS